MTEGDEKQGPANDNPSPDDQDGAAEDHASERIDAVVLSIARLIGRRMAREDFDKAIRPANDNAPKSGDEPNGEGA